MKLFTCLMIAAAVSAPIASSAADTFVIDPAHSSVDFSVRHMLVSTVRGSFTGIEGAIEFDAEDISRSSVAVTIPAAGIGTGNADRDAHLRSADFFDVEKYPELTFRSSAVERSGEGWVLRGTLTMHGVSREVSIPFHLNGPIIDPMGNARMGVEAEPVRLNRKDFGITWNKVLDGGGVAVSDEVTVLISLAAVHKAAKPESSTEG